MPVELTRVDEFALITLNRPEALNALSFQIVREIGEAIEEAVGTNARALLFTGTGEKAFCAGADISELVGRSVTDIREGARRGQNIFAKLDELSIPSIAVINGFALGGGLELALACTFRVAGPKARMGLPEVKLGLIPGYGGTQRLPRHIGEARAMELILTGRFVEALEAQQIGLIQKVIDGDLMAGAIEFARTFSGYSLATLKLAREATRRALDVNLDEGLKIEADLNSLSFLLEDAKTGTEAFLAKQQPKFSDR
ncbi:MAG: enoyl-CoA hydratase-related protein [Rhodospirillales bacterium]|jgi:enoyl-CoA hydratase